MPIYEYECPKCGGISERIEKMNENKRNPKCAKCDKAMSKIMSNNTFKLKGKGWFATDYPKTKEQPKAG